MEIRDIVRKVLTEGACDNDGYRYFIDTNDGKVFQIKKAVLVGKKYERSEGITIFEFSV